MIVCSSRSTALGRDGTAAVTGVAAANVVAPVTFDLRASGSSGYTIFRICRNERAGNVGAAFMYPSWSPLVVSEADVFPCARPQQGASMKAPTPFWSLAVVSILAFELNPSACSFSSERPVGGVGGNNGSPATGGQTGSAGNPGLAGT